MPPAVDGGMAGWEGGVGGLWVEWGEVMDREGKGTEALCILLPLTPPHLFFSPTTSEPILSTPFTRPLLQAQKTYIIAPSLRGVYPGKISPPPSSCRASILARWPSFTPPSPPHSSCRVSILASWTAASSSVPGTGSVR